MKTLLITLALFSPLSAFARENICDGEAIDCAEAHLNFSCGSAYIGSSTLIAPNLYDVRVNVGCGYGTREVNVQVKWDGLACICTSVTAPGDGG
jgi:hypothetical protein